MIKNKLDLLGFALAMILALASAAINKSQDTEVLPPSSVEGVSVKLCSCSTLEVKFDVTNYGWP
jgi:hypothetical protein